ncbi:unnamed protein product [Rhodiola kirilowii]
MVGILYSLSERRADRRAYHLLLHSILLALGREVWSSGTAASYV